jgi:hypothetical protein
MRGLRISKSFVWARSPINESCIKREGCKINAIT